MRNAVVLFLILLLSFTVIAQKRPAVRKRPAAAAKAPKAEPPKPLDEKEEFQKASALEIAAERVSALKKFLADFPESENANAARELIASSRVLIAEEMVNAGDMSGAAGVYKLAVEEAPGPIPAELFEESIAKIPSNLFWHGARPAALDVAAAIEKRVAANAAQLIELANFYISIEDGAEALRLAQAATAADPNSEAAYRTLAIADRLNFDLEGSGAAFAKALELDPDSQAAKRGLAETKRALGKPDEAIALYREMVEKNDSDLPARTGLILALFDAGKRAEAETELSRSLEQNPANIILLAGAAYWYAANGNGAKAVELAQKAIDKEPRYIWSHIALGRGLMAQKKPVEAEQALIKARQYGNFPTLEYEIASARAKAGFYRDAVEGLRKTFSVSDGMVHAKLGGRIDRAEAGFSDLVAHERRASIFTPTGADDAETARQLKLLLDLDEKLAAPAVDEAAIAADVDEFTQGSDKMKVHRQLYAATLLLQKKVDLPKVIELTKAATTDQDAGLEVANSGAAVMASELYEARSVAFARDEFLLVPDVPRQTLSAILRGRIEELAGWALFNQGSFPEAEIRLRRAISVLPDKSAWWRSSMWRLGAALEAEGKEKEALDSYIQSYKTDKPDTAKYIVVESLYKKLNGGTEGLEAAIGANRVMASPTAVAQAAAENAAAAAEPPQPVATPAAAAPPTEISFPRGVPVDTEKPVVQTEAVKITPAEVHAAEPRPETTLTGTAKAEPEKKVEEVPAKKVEEAKSTEVKNEDAAPETAKAASVKSEEVKREDVKREDVKAETARTDEPTSVPVPAASPEPAKPAATDAEKRTETKQDTPPEPPAETKQAEVPAAPENKTPAEPSETESRPAVDEKTAEPPAAEPSQKPVEPEPSKVEPQPPPPTDSSKSAEDKSNNHAESRPAETPSQAVAARASTVPPSNETESKRPPKLVVVTEELPPPVDLTKKPKPAAKKSALKTVAADESLFKPVIIPVQGSSAKPGETAARKPAERNAGDTLIVYGAGRSRVVEGREVKGDPPPACSVTSSENSVAIMAGGGSIGLIVGIEGPGDVRDITAASSSPDDVSVTLEPEIAGFAGKRFYAIKSISRSLGVFQVTFDAKCGRKEVLVSVR